MNRNLLGSSILACLILFTASYIAVSSGFISVNVPFDPPVMTENQANSKISTKEYDEMTKFATQLQEENTQLRSDINLYESRLKEYENYASDVQKQANKMQKLIETEESKPKTIIIDQKIQFEFSDSTSHYYSWEIPIETYESYVKIPDPQYYINLEMPDGTTVKVYDHAKFVKQSFTKVIDQVYDNAGSDEQFLYELWYIVAQLTTYSVDIDEDPRWALETLSRGGGDCEDTSILLADMIKSSSHARNWDVNLWYFDMNHPANPREVNHVAVHVDTGRGSHLIESTAKTEADLNAWRNTEITYWAFDV